MVRRNFKLSNETAVSHISQITSVRHLRAFQFRQSLLATTVNCLIVAGSVAHSDCCVAIQSRRASSSGSKNYPTAIHGAITTSCPSRVCSR